MRAQTELQVCAHRQLQGGVCTSGSLAWLILPTKPWVRAELRKLTKGLRQRILGGRSGGQGEQKNRGDREAVTVATKTQYGQAVCV